MWKLAGALLFIPVLAMVGAPSQSVKHTSATHNSGAVATAQDLSFGTTAHAAAYPAISPQTLALVMAH